MSATGMQSRRPLLGWTIHDSLIIARSTITASFRIPEALFFQLIQPVIFVLLFALPNSTQEQKASELLMKSMD